MRSSADSGAGWTAEGGFVVMVDRVDEEVHEKYNQ
jgi:hypothetical protein